MPLWTGRTIFTVWPKGFENKAFRDENGCECIEVRTLEVLNIEKLKFVRSDFRITAIRNQTLDPTKLQMTT